MADENKSLHWLNLMVWLGVAVAFLILLVDMKLKNDIVGELKNVEGRSGTRNWTYADPGNASVRANGTVRFAPQMEEGADNTMAEAPLIPEDERGVGDGSEDPGIPEGDKPVGP